MSTPQLNGAQPHLSHEEHPKFSLFRHNTKPDPIGVMSIGDLLDCVAQNKAPAELPHLDLAKTTAHLKAIYAEHGKGQKYDDGKDNAPCFTASGVFSYRAAKKLTKHNGYVGVDIDDVDPVEARDTLAALPHCVFAARSVAGGAWALFSVDPIPDNAAEHKAAWRAVTAFVKEQTGYDNDDATHDLARLRYLASDVGAIYNEQAGPLAWTMPVEEAKPVAPVRTFTGDADLFEKLRPIATREDSSGGLRFSTDFCHGGTVQPDTLKVSLVGGRLLMTCFTHHPSKDGAQDFGATLAALKAAAGIEANRNGNGVYNPAPKTPAPAEMPKAPALQVVDKYCDDLFRSTLAPREFHRAIFLAVCGTVLAPARYISTPWGKRIIPNLFVGLIAESTIHGKTTAISAGIKLLQHPLLESYLLPTSWTPERLITTFAEAQIDEKVVSGICQRDELRDLLRPAKEYMSGSRELLLRMYDNQRVHVATQKRGDERVHSPALSIIGATTPEHAAQAIGQADYSDGFIPRWIFQMPEQDKTWGQRAEHVDISWAQEEIGRLAELPSMEYSCSQFQLNTVQDWGEGKQQDVELDSNRDFKLALYGRSQDRALRFAVILQSLWAPDKQPMTDEALQAGMELSDYYDHQAQGVQELAEARRIDRGKLAKILTLIPDVGITERDLHRALRVSASGLAAQLDAFTRVGALERYRDGRRSMVRVLHTGAEKIRL